MTNLPATVETVESLLYGTTIKIQQALDLSEAMQMDSFIQTNGAALKSGDPVAFENYLNLMAEIWSTPANPLIVSADQILNTVVMTGVVFVEAVTTGQTLSLFSLDSLLLS